MILVEWAATLDYQSALDLQKDLVAERESDSDLPDHLLLLEHPHTYTIGRNGRTGSLLLDEETRKEKGVALYHVDRGGDITYHGPGQLVGYPILNLQRLYGRGIGRVRRYITDLEAIIIQLLAEFDILAFRLENHRGVWVESAAGVAKIAAVGVHVTARGISSHGFALNVNPNLSYFAGIVPCGITEYGVTSMAEQLDHPLQIAEVLPYVAAAISKVLGVEIIHAPGGEVLSTAATLVAGI